MYHNANDVPQSIGFDSILNLAQWRSQDRPEQPHFTKCPYFEGLALSPHMDGKHTHTHTQIRGEGRRVDTEQHTGRLNQPGYEGRVPSLRHTQEQKYQWGRHGSLLFCNHGNAQRGQSVPVAQQALTR